MKTIDNLLQIKARITSKVDSEIEYLLSVGNEITEVINGAIEKRESKLSTNDEKSKQALDSLSKSIDLEFAAMNHKLYFSIGALEKNVLAELTLLSPKDPSYEDKLDKIMGNFDESLEKEEKHWIDKFSDCHESSIKKMDHIINNSITFDKLNNFLKKSNNLSEKNNDGKRNLNMQF